MVRVIRIAVIYGGQSTEHSISCISAGSIMAELDRERYEIFPVGITREGAWVVGEIDPIASATLPEVREGREIALSLNPARRGEFVDAFTGESIATVDVVFPVLHGKYGEDGTIQGMFELSGIPYVGPGVMASACSIDKEYTKKLAVQAGLNVTREVVLEDNSGLSAEQREYLGLPVFVKPASGGSSIGVSKVTTWDEIDAALATAFETDNKVVVEAEVIGDEVEVGVLEYPDGSVVASVPAKLNGTDDGAEGFYGFETKYLEDGVTATIPAPYDEATIDELRSLAVRTFRGLNCKGLARVDFFVTENGPVLNEINTMPGFTPISMYPQMWQASGLTYGQLLDALITTSLGHSER
ncbi:D-alanine--D-alanine ligase family protein [Corynebacterium sp.]|uniref:D-alanine--D-alanine ligase family protein n=1 Tax=Corynebacterium sp. TaxID=1720 RepID=UPI002A911D70|nr:D-alanine--D-alanine ligase family protein [Corynebacterium sp.]MDY5784929.1 D-alanine--D-alanine ligase family protein [Corynebacterium sp.]